MTPSPVAPDEDNDNFIAGYYRMDVEALNDWATVTSFLKGSIRLVVQEPEDTDDFKQFLIIMYGSDWENRVLGHQTTIIEQLYALITGYSELTSRQRRVCLELFSSWTPIQIWTQIKGLAEAGGFLQIK